MLILRERDVLSLLSNLSKAGTRSLLSSFHKLLRQYSSSHHEQLSEKLIHQPERVSIVTKDGNTALFMPSSVTTSTGIKVVTVPSKGLIKGSINVFAPDGELEGVINAAEITAFRTSLAVMIPFELYQKDKANIVVFGAGRQAEWHIKLALLLADVKYVTVVNRSGPGRTEPLFEDLRSKYPAVKFDVLLKDDPKYDVLLQARLKDAKVIFCCTPSVVPHFPASYLDSTPRFISLIGSYKPNMQEIDASTLLSGDRIYVDTKEGCLVEAGELIMANVKEDQLLEIGELPKDAPLEDTGNVIFKCVGMGVMDVFMAAELLRMAKEKQLGVIVDDFWEFSAKDLETLGHDNDTETPTSNENPASLLDISRTGG
jgi:ornithine cyclodeaminase/alanine dehydrogenase-like protein (mu-crystallin family)